MADMAKNDIALLQRSKEMRPNAIFFNDMRALVHDLESGRFVMPLALDILTVTAPCYDETRMRQYNERDHHRDGDLPRVQQERRHRRSGLQCLAAMRHGPAATTCRLGLPHLRRCLRHLAAQFRCFHRAQVRARLCNRKRSLYPGQKCEYTC